MGAARAFGAAGFNLSLLSRNPENVTPLIPRLNEHGVEAEWFKCNAGDFVSLSEAIQQATTKFGDPELILYNAVSFSKGKPSTIDPQTLSADFAVNVAGALAAARHVLPKILERRSGTLLFTGGGLAIYPSAEYASLSIGKAGMRTLVLVLAEELKGTGVRAGTITVMGYVAPGTPFDPDTIGNAFLELYRQPDESFSVELLFKGKKQS
jgi:NADP-dependent 3-hydroxy acid dehydrogenase YdfG